MKGIAKEVLKLLRASIPSTIEINETLHSEKTVLADPTAVHQVMMNLCTNAAHAMQPKGGLLELRLNDVMIDAAAAQTYPGLKQGMFVKLTVHDTGCGMTPEVMERIFDPFFTTKEQGEGSGMGLAVVHGLVNGCKGSIFIDSELNKGTVFSVFFPGIDKKPQEDTPKEGPIPTGTERILFVDDEEAIVELNTHQLKSLGYQVTGRTNPLEALALFKAKPESFDLVITDLTMPIMTGLMLSEELKNIRSDIPIILCTGFSATLDSYKKEAFGIGALIHKPILRRTMAVAIRTLLDNG